MRTAAILLVASCALTSNAPPQVLRYFSPEVATQRPPARIRCGHLALGRVRASDHLRYRIVHRTSRVEVSPFETLRWTERPDIYVERALSRHLFDIGGLVQSVAPADLALEVDVLAFEKVDAPRPTGRVQLAFRLRDDRTIVSTDVITVERPGRSADIAAVVDAIGQATEAAAAEVAARVIPTARAREGCEAMHTQ